MATYYVTTGGNASNTGLSPTAPWTLAKAFLSAVAGDIVYIAPGVYRGAFTLSNSGTSGNRIQFIGDPLATQGWSGISAGQVRITNISDDVTGTALGATVINGSSSSWISFNKISFECIRANTVVALQISVGWSITQCQIVAISTNTVCQALSGSNGVGGVDLNFTFTRNVVVCNGSGLYMALYRHTAEYGVTVNIKNCIFFGHNTTGEAFGLRVFALGTGNNGGGYVVQNCTYIGFSSAISFDIGNGAFKHNVTNSLFIGNITALTSTLGTGAADENYNRILAQVARNGFPTGISSVVGSLGVEYGYNQIVGLPVSPYISSILGSPNVGFGISTNALATDIYGNNWAGTLPDAGAATYGVISSVGQYIPTERNASAITITPGSTSQSIELYLGSTGITTMTGGLSATYNKNRTADVDIPLVTRTIAQPWVAGGFAEVNPVTMPGVYRLDIPNEAISIGYGNTTLVVRGVSGTNGAVVTIQEPQAVGTQLRMGPFTVQADGILTDDRLKLIQGSVHSIDFKMVDAYGTGVDGTGTVVTAKVYNAAGFLIDTYTCTAMYALDGRYSFAIDSTVTDNVGMYTINIYRQISTETNVFGRMKLEVLSP